MARQSFHGKDGRFTSYNRANTVSKDGERFRMVRTLELIKPEKDPEPAPEPKSDQAEAVLHAKAKVREQVPFIENGMVFIDEICGSHSLTSQDRARFVRGNGKNKKRKGLDEVKSFGGGYYILVKKGAQHKFIGPYKTMELAAIHSVAMRSPEQKNPTWYDVALWGPEEIDNYREDPGAYEADSVKFVKPSDKTVRVHSGWKKVLEKFAKSSGKPLSASRRDDLMQFPANVVFSKLEQTNVLKFIPGSESLRSKLRALS